MLRIPAAVALAIALAQPALATTVYVPFADRLQAGAPQQRTELSLTNDRSSIAERVTYRVFVDGSSGSVKERFAHPDHEDDARPRDPRPTDAR